MDATILRSFVDQPKGRESKRYSAGDVVSMSQNDFDRIQEQSGGKYLKEGRHPFGQGVCYPCQKSKSKPAVKKKTAVKQKLNPKTIEKNG